MYNSLKLCGGDENKPTWVETDFEIHINAVEGDDDKTICEIVGTDDKEREWFLDAGELETLWNATHPDANDSKTRAITDNWGG